MIEEKKDNILYHLNTPGLIFLFEVFLWSIVWALIVLKEKGII